MKCQIVTNRGRPLIGLAAVVLAISLLILNHYDHRLQNRNAARPDGVEANGFLLVKNGGLVNCEGRPVQLRGLSSHGLIWFPQYVNIRAMADLRSRGANLFRAAMYADSLHEGYNDNEISKRLNFSLMCLAIENALAADMYIIVDWHLLQDKNPLVTVEAARVFFNEISSRYPDQPGLIYEICNEPSGETTWADIQAYARQIIPVIRANAPRAVILVGTPNHSADLSKVREAPLDYENLMYAYHVYFDAAPGDDYQAKIDPMLDAGLGVFISEWGIGRLENSLEGAAEVHGFLDYCRRRRISWANWSLSNKDESYSAVKPDCQKLSGWTDDDLTLSGRIVFHALQDR
jgi:aryl-phospho-beta-D-glucosidase BglC (GH1 family)